MHQCTFNKELNLFLSRGNEHMSRASSSSLLKVDRFQMIMTTLKICSFLR